MNHDKAERVAAAIVEAVSDIAEAVHRTGGRPLGADVYQEARNGIVTQLMSDEPEDDGPSLFGDDAPAPPTDFNDFFGPAVQQKRPAPEDIDDAPVRSDLIERLFDDQAFREGYEAGNHNGAMGVWTMFSVLFPRYVKAGQNNPGALMLRIAREVEKLAGRTVYGEATRERPE